MYNLREACEHIGTIVESSEHGQYIALKTSYPLLYHNQANAPSILLLALTSDASRYSPLYILPPHL